MWFASGETSWIPLYVFLLFVLISYYKKQSWSLIFPIILLIIMSDQLASGVIKPLTERLRPSHQPGLEPLLHFVNSYQGGTYGFVSSHACNFFALVTYLSMATAKRILWLPYLLFPIAALVTYSRVYLGVHYPSDVLVAAILGIFIGWVISKLYNRLNQAIQTKASTNKISA
ncbi:phosphatase PAP2 family protein [Taibaiella soli]|uniref:Phosphatase PAP2 family protein n=2 Tax=Taibaiella soli TaxID=1649169 RepID=A0A2W2AEB9_9BACT|nr:phosphatase PAP2 family protein [Taibaiella soli]